MLILRESPKNEQKIKQSEDIAKIMSEIYNARSEEDKHKEFFYAAGLDSQNRVIYIDLVAIGTVNSCAPSVREILRTAIVKNAVGVILVHNHPSGDTKPSDQDSVFTHKTRRAFDEIGIKLLDHIIIGDSFYSYADNGNI